MTDDLSWHLETPRLRIRPVVIGDAAAIFAARTEIPFDPPIHDLAKTEAIVAEMASRVPGAASCWDKFAVIDRASATLIGDISVRFGHPRPLQAEIGFALAPWMGGRGFAAEALGQLVEHLFGPIGLHRIIAVTDARNLTTQRLLARLGFRIEARYRQSWREDDAWFDEIGYAQLATEC